MEDQTAKELHEGGELLPYQDEVMLEEGEEQSAADRVLAVVTAPKRAFAGILNIRLGGVIGISFAVAILLNIVSTLLMFSSPDVVEAMKTNQIEQIDKRLDDLSLSSAQKEQVEQQREQVEGMSSTTYMIGGVITSVLGVPFIALLVGLLILLIAKVIEEGRETRIRFVHALAVAALGSVISGIGSLLSAAIMKLTGTLEVPLGLAAIIKPDSKVLQGVVGVLNLPYLWWMIVIGIGIAAIARSSVAKSTLIFFSSILVITLLISLLLSQIGVAFGF
ncbi:MAG: YIP1 family protein [Ignavibacteriae bacterium]|nr:YIP1 family protein [Ignavibacteriota bacterium]MCB9216978.1 YIP1 family protein [Ignavibacteria bacterium]